MEKIEIITYATHNEGTLNELIHNKFHIPITVLGWGKKWRGFTDKYISMASYLDNLPDDKLIFFVDGFDTKINADLNTIYRRFKDMNSDIVVSLHNINNFLARRVFGNCRKNFIANSGLYGGYNRNLKQLLKYILNKNYSKDDQTNLNEACKYFRNIKVDETNYLFENQGYLKRYFDNHSDSCFVSTPGVLTWKRLRRVPGEYLPFLWREVLIVIIIVIAIIGANGSSII